MHLCAKRNTRQQLLLLLEIDNRIRNVKENLMQFTQQWLLNFATQNLDELISYYAPCHQLNRFNIVKDQFLIPGVILDDC